MARDESDLDGTVDDSSADRHATSTARSLRMIARDLWYQKPGPREPRQRPQSTKEIVNGLDQREYVYGWAFSLLALATGVLVYFKIRTSTNVKDRNDAIVELVSVLIGGACMVAGTALKRRALVGFASFLVGLEMFNYAGYLGLLWLGFGLWLISRVMKKQRLDRDAKKSAGAKAPAKRAATGPPKASKRYTPPKARSSSGRRR